MEEIKTEEDVNKRFLSGYYLYEENGKDILINGIDHTIRELNGKNLTKIPSVIICTKDKNSTRYVSNRDRPVNGFNTISGHYKKVIDKKDYFYDFSKFYYIENEGGEGPSKVVLHNKDFDYNGYTYSNGYLSKKLSGNLTANDLGLDGISSIEVNNVTVSINKTITIAVKANDDSVLLFDGTEISDYKKIIKVKGTKDLDDVSLRIIFYFHGPIINDSERFTHSATKITISANYYKPIKEIGTITKSENCQYGIYRLKNNNTLYDVNKYIVLKFDELAALPTNITDFYTRKPTDNYVDLVAVATLLNNPEGNKPGDNVPNIIQPTETITEVYAIKHY